MGGFGSGRQGGRVTIRRCDSRRLATKDLRALLRSPDGGNARLSYRVAGRSIMNVELEVRPSHGYMRLQHPTRVSASAATTALVDYTIGLTSTEAGFGGRRWWFVCPILRRRCAVLYLPRGAHRFGSAEGYGLAHDVTRFAEVDRLWHRMAGIARRLGDEGPAPDAPPPRPRWMRTPTYDRLLDSWHEAAERRDNICDSRITGFLARLGGRFGG
jgi:hypothetical protein